MNRWSVIPVAITTITVVGCVYPVTTDKIAIAASATNLTPAERSVMYLSGEKDPYRLLDPEIPELDWSIWRANYFPPGAIAVAPGSHRFNGGRFFGYCRFTVTMAAGHVYRPAHFDCRYYPDHAVTGVMGKCLADNPGNDCCAALDDTALDGTNAELAVPCDLPPGQEVAPAAQ